MKRTKQTDGFTFPELMISMGIVGVLSTVAMGSIRPSLEHSRKVSAEGVLHSLARDCSKAMIQGSEMLEPRLSHYRVKQVTFKKGSCWDAEDDVTVTATPSSKHRFWTTPLKAVAEYESGDVVMGGSDG